MATLYTTEFNNPTDTVDGSSVIIVPFVELGYEPALTTQKTTFTTAAQTSAFNADTNFVRLVATADCHILFGASPTATSSHEFFVANVEYWRGVGNGDKLSVYDGTS